MGKVTYALRLAAGLVMVTAIIAGFGSFSDAMNNFGPEGEPTLAVMLLIAATGFLVAFLTAGILWVVSDLSQQLELSRLQHAKSLISSERHIKEMGRKAHIGA